MNNVYILAYKNMLSTFLHRDSASATTSTVQAMLFNSYIEAKNFRKGLPKPKDWLIERIN